MGQKPGVDAYTEKPFVRITYIHVNHRFISNGGWGLHGDGCILGTYGKGEVEVNDCKPALYMYLLAVPCTLACICSASLAQTSAVHIACSIMHCGGLGQQALLQSVQQAITYSCSDQRHIGHCSTCSIDAAFEVIITASNILHALNVFIFLPLHPLLLLGDLLAGRQLLVRTGRGWGRDPLPPCCLLVPQDQNSLYPQV